MVRNFLGVLLLFLAILSSACSSGSSSGGGGSATGSTGTTTGGDAPIIGGGGTNTPTYSEKDLTGNWNYIASPQGGGQSCSGTMTFSGTSLIGYTNSCCSTQSITRAEFWTYSDGYVKGRNFAWCTDTSLYTKYSLNYSGPNKRTLAGLMDLHQDPQYVRFNITLTR